jgi:hypothetical protein
MTTSAADGLLYLLASHPDLLDPYTGDNIARDIEVRRHAERPCLRCSGTARIALIAQPQGPPARWLDLCPVCYDWLSRNVTPAPATSVSTP